MGAGLLLRTVSSERAGCERVRGNLFVAKLTSGGKRHNAIHKHQDGGRTKRKKKKAGAPLGICIGSQRDSNFHFSLMIDLARIHCETRLSDFYLRQLHV